MTKVTRSSNAGADHFAQNLTFGGAHIEYRSFDLADVQLNFDSAKLAEGAVRVDSVVLGNESLAYTERFGISFATLLKQSPSVFSLFDVSEVIARALARKKVFGQAVITIDRTNPSAPRALAVAPYTKKFFTLSHLQRYVEEVGSNVSLNSYNGNGVFSLNYDLSIIHRPVTIQSKDFHPVMTMRLSIDGWGRPTAWLALRMGKDGHMLKATADAFRTSANIGEESGKYVSALSRFTRSFSNEEGFGVLHARLDAAHKAFASLAEFQSFERAVNRSAVSERALKKVATLSHDEANRFGLTSLSVVSRKRTVRVPSRHSIADLLIMGVEIASTEAKGDVEPIFEWVGAVLAEEGGFDLEGTLDEARPTKLTYLSEDTLGDAELSTAADKNVEIETLPDKEDDDKATATIRRNPGSNQKKTKHREVDQGEADDGYQPDPDEDMGRA